MTPRDPTLSTLDESLSQSHQLAALISAAWESTPLFAAPRTRAAQGLCAVSLHHGAGVLTLLPSLPGSAITLMRPQFETLVRAVWAAHAASDAELACLLAPLVPESQQAAKKLPGIPEMLSRLELSGPRGAAPLLARARTRLGDGLNSFVHGGIHPFARQRTGYPVGLLLDVLKNSNALAMLTVIVLATLVDDHEVGGLLPGLHETFADVLPTLEPLDRATTP